MRPLSERVERMLRMDGERFTGEATVYFATAEAAKEAAERAVTFDGNIVYLKWAGVPSETPEEASRRRREQRAQTVFTNRWPEGTTEVAVKETFPTATRVVLRTDGGRFSGAVKLYFSSADEALKAAAKEVTVNGISLWMRWGGHKEALAERERENLRFRTLITEGWPAETTAGEVKRTFPDAEDVGIH